MKVTVRMRREIQLCACITVTHLEILKETKGEFAVPFAGIGHTSNVQEYRMMWSVLFVIYARNNQLIYNINYAIAL